MPTGLSVFDSAFNKLHVHISTDFGGIWFMEIFI